MKLSAKNNTSHIYIIPDNNKQVYTVLNTTDRNWYYTR